MPSSENQRSNENTQLERVLQLVSGELSLLASASNRLQGSIGDVLKNSVVGQPETIYDLQNLDRLTQTIEALADFMNQLSLQMQSDWSVDAEHAARTMTLAAVAARLSTSGDEVPQDNPDEDLSGECVYL